MPIYLTAAIYCSYNMKWFFLLQFVLPLTILNPFLQRPRCRAVSTRWVTKCFGKKPIDSVYFVFSLLGRQSLPENKLKILKLQWSQTCAAPPTSSSSHLAYPECNFYKVFPKSEYYCYALLSVFFKGADRLSLQFYYNVLFGLHIIMFFFVLSGYLWNFISFLWIFAFCSCLRHHECHFSFLAVDWILEKYIINHDVIQ